MNQRDIRAYLEALPEIIEWPALVAIFDRAGDAPRPDWELPIRACQAVGGGEAMALPGAVAIACLQLSIILVDDILDDDPRGAHHDYGKGPTANMALAYQSIASLVLTQADISDEQKARASDALARTALQTAIGQHLDIQNFQGEESYWRVVKAKSTPFYAAALEIGSILGSATIQTAQNMNSLGATIGEIIQIEDDLADALEVPANADWAMGRNNLLLLYAQTADHEDRVRFVELLTEIDNPAALTEAQQILVSSGAVSYAVYQLVKRYREAKRRLSSMSLKEPSRLHEILDAYAETLLTLLRLSNIEISKDMLLDLEI